ncbi:MAG: tetratricopeptide repeat protein [Blastocatellia bacterium]
MKVLAKRYNSKGMELEEAGQFDEAIVYYEKAIKSAPDWSVPWYNLGLLYKYQKLWEKSLACTQRASELDANDEAAWWNLGIAATALENWPEARRAWKTYGIEIEPGDGPIEMDFGSVPIRLDPDGDAEVVWCKRIDPARAIVQNIPFSESGFRYGDLVLHDGAPNGYRKNENGKEAPIFDELQLLYPSEFGTFEALVDGISAEELDELIDSESEESGDELAIEDWGTIRILCRACSEGKPDDQHAHHHETVVDGERRIGFAAKTEERVKTLLADWQKKFPQATFSEIKCGLPPAWIN